MSKAYKCDRCGILYVPKLKFPKENWWRYDIIKDCHPYETVKIDLCDACKLSLAKWLDNKED